MRRTLLLLAAGIVLALTAAPAAFAQDDQNCEDFASQAEAQAHLEADSSDPDNLDADDDGQACETFDFGVAGGGTAPQQDEGDSLPFTGPGDAQLPLGAGLLAAGAAIVFLARYRPRHVRR